jgi:hypothetical protein
MKCFNCAHLRINASEPHSKQGIAVCIKFKGVFKSIKFERSCEYYKAADAGVIIKRMAWSEGLGK